ncbi:aromatic amino acid ammonia-lyase [Bacteroides ovatus]|nr:aromatic amino acid ammonia-lyase [Bacteroides ovatus]
MIADKSINLDTLHKVLFDNEKLELSEECIRKVEESFDFLQSFSSDKIIYGINTGFGTNGTIQNRRSVIDRPSV